MTFSDPPQMNPVELLLKKTGMEQEYVDPSGTAAYQGAQFLVKFYAELLDPGKKSGKGRGKSQSEAGSFKQMQKQFAVIRRSIR